MLTDDPGLRSRDVIPQWLIGAIALLAVVIAALAVVATLFGTPWSGMWSGMMSGRFGSPVGPAGSVGPFGMMGGRWGGSGGYVGNGPEPGTAGFVAGTTANPRVIRIVAGPGYVFSPSQIKVARGETVTFQVTTMGPALHEFMVGPVDAVAADREDTPEVADIAMMQTKSLTYTFDGPGPFAFACHAPGHYEAGMRGTITVVD
jgi:plastocyanin